MFDSILVADQIRLDSATRPLITGGRLSLAPGDRAALVGRNGSGKSTLLACIAAAAGSCSAPDHAQLHGSLWLAPGTRVGLLPQTPPPAAAGIAVAAHLAACVGGVARAHADYVVATARLAADPADPAALAAYGEALELMNADGAWDFEARHAELVSQLMRDIDQDRPVAALSGGQVTVVALAGLLLAEPDLLLLDEPTNNLDTNAIAFLGGMLANSRAAVLMVSHDRAFLDRTATQIIEIDEADGRLRCHRGNYSEHLTLRRQHHEAAQRAYLEQQRRRALLIADARRISGEADAFQSRSSNDYRRARGAKLARKAVVMERRVERELERLPEPAEPQRPRLVVGSVAPASGTLMRLIGVGVGFDRTPVLSDVALSLRAGDRVLIEGANGSGKTTLLRLMAGDLAASAGELQRAPNVGITLLTQLPPPPRPGDTCLDYARRLAPVSEAEAGAILGRVLFADVARRPVDGFSVGERRRIELAVLLAVPTAVLLLDEPTNHLDLLSLDMLDEAMEDYTGALVVVSHDEWLMRRLRHTRRLIVADGRVSERPADGDRATGMREGRPEPPPPPPPPVSRLRTVTRPQAPARETVIDVALPPSGSKVNEPLAP